VTVIATTTERVSAIFSPPSAPGRKPIAESREPTPDYRTLHQTSTRKAQLHDAAAKLVASALVQPAFDAMRNSPLRPTDGPFARNTLEKRFAPLLDQQFADRVTQAANFTLVDDIVRRLDFTRGASHQALSIREDCRLSTIHDQRLADGRGPKASALNPHHMPGASCQMPQRHE
jgi:Rod binding domain-containing protein